MYNFIRPTTINVLGGEQTRAYQDQYQNQSSSTPSRWKKFKAKVKRVWKTVMNVAEDIKENIMPIVTGVGSFLTSWATFCNRSRSSDRQWSTPVWSL